MGDGYGEVCAVFFLPAIFCLRLWCVYVRPVVRLSGGLAVCSGGDGEDGGTR